MLREWVIKMVHNLTLKHSREVIAEWFAMFRLVEKAPETIKRAVDSNRVQVRFDFDANKKYSDDLAEKTLEDNLEFISSCVGLFDDDAPSSGETVENESDDSTGLNDSKLDRPYIFGSDSNHGFKGNNGVIR